MLKQTMISRQGVCRPLRTQAATPIRSTIRVAQRFVVHSSNSQGTSASQVVGSWCASGLLAAALLLSPVSAAHAAETALPDVMSPTEEAYERQVEIDSRKRQLDYMLQQSDMVTKAQLYSLRAQVEAQSSGAEASLQQKITTERANQLSAQKSGNPRLAAAISAEEQNLEAQASKLRTAAAETQTKLSRQGMLERVRNLAFKQSIERGAQAAKDEVNSQLDVALEAGLKEGLTLAKAQ